jgi:PIF1-like helicase
MQDITGHGIVAQVNDVNEINDMVICIGQVPQEEVVCSTRANAMADPDDDDDYDVALPIEFLHTLQASRVPPHRLELKQGCHVIFMRSLTSGLTSGTFARALNDGTFTVRSPLGHCEENVVLAALKIDSPDTQWPFTVNRKQVPVKVAFVTTHLQIGNPTNGYVGFVLGKARLLPWPRACGILAYGRCNCLGKHGCQLTG